mmetsp:Transcript_882/g.1753  ORF Transcript_882/g.1753 Transcript_882/m.1753 type:complete len:316 (-) Transcript_882:70-1017(-)
MRVIRGPLSSPLSSEARVMYALYTVSRRAASSAKVSTPMRHGPSRVATHGPSSALASSPPLPLMPRLRALAAIIARVEAGRPATSPGAVSTLAKALVASSTALEKAVERAASSFWISSKRAFFLPVSPTPASSPVNISSSAARRCAGESAPHAAASARSAHQPLCSAREPDILEEKATTSGSIASEAERSAAESLTIFRWLTTPHGPETSSPRRSTESARNRYAGVSPRARTASTSRSSASRPDCAFASRSLIAGCTCSARTSAKRGKSAGAFRSGLSVSASAVASHDATYVEAVNAADSPPATMRLAMIGTPPP